ncbi:MAG TPA: hypothetical protein VGR45_06305 [Stellaceae bacterium]|nr:hypothetical protein [Stellaceae bacterium]
MTDIITFGHEDVALARSFNERLGDLGEAIRLAYQRVSSADNAASDRTGRVAAIRARAAEQSAAQAALDAARAAFQAACVEIRGHRWGE